MKQILQLLSRLILCTPLAITAQVVITEADVPPIGKVWISATDTDVVNVNVGLPGPNQTWDLTNVTMELTDTAIFSDPATTPWGADFPDAQLAVQNTSNSRYIYLDVSPDSVFAIGLAGEDPTGQLGGPLVIPLQDPHTFVVFPAEIGVSFTDTSIIDQTEAGDGINYDSIRYRSVRIYTVNYDGWGILDIPTGSYSVLRSYTEGIQIDTAWILVANQWVPVYNQMDSIKSWDWLSPAAQSIAASVYLNSDGTYNIDWTLLDPPPIAAFDTTQVGLGSFDFTDLSYNDPVSWAWDFGDGNTSNMQNPSHTYTASGTYTVCLAVSNSAGSDTTCMTIEVTLPPIADFEYTDNGNGNFDFQDLSLNNPTSWSWDFGDGNTSNMQNPSHTFAEPGDYTVCLVVANSAGTDTACMTISVIITSLTEQWQGIALKVFPNPASDVLRIQIDWQEPLVLTLYDLLGRPLYQETFTGQVQVPLFEIPNGHIWYSLHTVDGTLVARGPVLVLKQ